VTWQEHGICCNRKKGRWPGLLPCLLNAAGTHPRMGRTGSGTNTTGYPPILGNSRVCLTNPASANPQVHSRGNRLVGLPTEESHDFSRGRSVNRTRQSYRTGLACRVRARYALGVEPVPTETLAACDVHSQFASNAPGPVVATSDGGLVGRESDDDSTDNAGSDRLDPRAREHVEEHGSRAHGYDHAPEP
jgi:hypothetical protein